MQEATPAWYASLAFASWVDARRNAIDGRFVWSRGQIVEEAGERFHVHFYHHAGGVPYDTAWFSKLSPDLAPEGSKVGVPCGLACSVLVACCGFPSRPKHHPP